MRSDVIALAGLFFYVCICMPLSVSAQTSTTQAASLTPRLVSDQSEYLAADRRVWLRAYRSLPLGKAPELRRLLIQEMSAAFDQDKQLQLADHAEVLHWLRTFSTSRYSHSDLLVSWKLEARWLTSMHVIQGAKGCTVILRLTDGLTGEKILDLEEREVAAEDIKAMVDNWVKQVNLRIKEMKTGKLLVIEAHAKEWNKKSGDYTFQPDLGPRLNQLFNLPGIVILHPELGRMVSSEQRLFAMNEKISDPYWTKPLREVLVLRYDVDLYRHPGKRIGTWHPKIRLSLGQGDDQQRFDFQGAWKDLAKAENRLLNELNQALMKRLKLPEPAMIPLNERDQDTWQAWHRLARTDRHKVYSYDSSFNQDKGKMKLVMDECRSIVKDYPWFKPVYLEVGMDPGTTASHRISREHPDDSQFFKEQMKKNFGQTKPDEVSKYLGGGVSSFAIRIAMNRGQLNKQLLKMYRERPDLALEFYPEQTAKALWKVGERNRAYDIMIRNWHFHMLGYPYDSYPRSFVRFLLKEKEYILMMEILRKSAPLNPEYFGSRLEQDRIIPDLKKQGQHELADELNRLSVKHTNRPINRSISLRKIYYRQTQDFKPLVKKIKVTGGEVIDVKWLSIRAVDQFRGQSVLDHQEGRYRLIRLVPKIQKHIFTEQQLASSELNYKSEQDRLIDLGDRTWLMLRDLGLYEFTYPEQFNDPIIKVIDAEWMKGLTLADLWADQENTYLLAWDESASRSVLAIKKGQGEWQVKPMPANWKKVHRLIHIDKEALTLWSDESKHLYRYLLNTNEFKPDLKLSSYSFTPDIAVRTNRLTLTADQNNRAEPISVFYGDSLRPEHLYFGPPESHKRNQYLEAHWWYYKQSYIEDYSGDRMQSVPMNGAPKAMFTVKDQVWILDQYDALTITLDGEEFYGPFYFGGKIDSLEAAGDQVFMLQGETLRAWSHQEIKNKLLQDQHRISGKASYEKIKADIMTWLKTRPNGEQLHYYDEMWMYQEQAEILMKLETQPSREAVLKIAALLMQDDQYEKALAYMKKHGVLIENSTEAEEAILASITEQENWKKLHELTQQLWKTSQLTGRAIPVHERVFYPIWAIGQTDGDEAYRTAMWKWLHGVYPEAAFDWDTHPQSDFVVGAIRSKMMQRLVGSLRREKQFNELIDHPLLGAVHSNFHYAHEEWKIFAEAGRFEECIDHAEYYYERATAFTLAGEFEEALKIPPFKKRTSISEWPELRYIASMYTGHWELYDQTYRVLMNEGSYDSDWRKRQYQSWKLFREDSDQAAKALAHARGRNYAHDWKGADLAYAVVVKEYPESIAAAESLFYLAESAWLLKADHDEALKLWKQAAQIYETKLNSEAQSIAEYAAFRLGQLAIFMDQDHAKAMTFWQKSKQGDKSLPYLRQLTKAHSLSTSKLGVGHEDAMPRVRVALVNLNEKFMTIQGPKPVGPGVKSHYLSADGRVYNLYNVSQGDEWETCYVKLFNHPQQNRPGTGWVYLNDPHAHEWVWVIYHQLEGEALDQLKQQVDVMNKKLAKE